MRRLRIVIADDHEVVRRGIRSLVESRPEWQVCAEASTGAETLDLAEKERPDILLLDVSMPDRNGIDITRELQVHFSSTAVIILTMHETPMIVGEALAVGARGMVYKSDAGKDLLNAIEAVSEKKPFVSQRVTEIIMKSGVPRPETTPTMQLLTEREMEVLKMLAEGKNVKEIGAELKISPKTVNVHRANIMEKLQLHTLPDLIYFAIRNKIVTI